MTDYGNISPEAAAKFWAKVDTSSNGCWLWTAAKSRQGYGRFLLNQKNRQAHRVSYLLRHGKIPDGLTLDHICMVRHCVNPDHLDPVTHEVNVKRARAARTHCRNGHERTSENTIINQKTGLRYCRPCKMENDTKRRGRANG